MAACPLRTRLMGVVALLRDPLISARKPGQDETWCFFSPSIREKKGLGRNYAQGAYKHLVFHFINAIANPLQTACPSCPST